MIRVFCLFHSCVPKSGVKIKALFQADFSTAVLRTTCGKLTPCVSKLNESTTVLSKALLLCLCICTRTVQGLPLIKLWLMEPACAFELLSRVYLDVTVKRELCTRDVVSCREQEICFQEGFGGLLWFAFPHFMPVVLWMSSSYLVVRYLNDDSSQYG